MCILTNTDIIRENLKRFDIDVIEAIDYNEPQKSYAFSVDNKGRYYIQCFKNDLTIVRKHMVTAASVNNMHLIIMVPQATTQFEGF